tara:strand:- start:18 stop:497 length:480 start_codon:yes stop_codon:yes gene_type:complete
MNQTPERRQATGCSANMDETRSLPYRRRQDSFTGDFLWLGFWGAIFFAGITFFGYHRVHISGPQLPHPESEYTMTFGGKQVRPAGYKELSRSFFPVPVSEQGELADKIDSNDDGFMTLSEIRDYRLENKPKHDSDLDGIPDTYQKPQPVTPVPVRTQIA